ncbi:class I SAM-dependent methyltransferase [Candidatus Woesearchaeota archaeon]|nr:class I SAM-dependent methyltransferase [Candidatus Woesearchaeota archaeon]
MAKKKKQAKPKFVKHSKEEKLYHEPEDLRWATNEAVANHRAQRLRCDTIADLGCGIGFQAFAFARTCKRVIAVDVDDKKIALASKNAEVLKIKNIEFVQGDVLDDVVVKKLSGADIVFCDPERIPEEGERSISSIKPDLKKLVAKYSKITSAIAIELPPQIKNIPFDCEKEYSSVNGKLNRLTMYVGELRRCDRSAVILPSEAVLNNKDDVLVTKSDELFHYLYEADPAIVKADLLAELSQETGTMLFEEAKQVFFTSDKLVKNDFFKNRFEVLEQCDFDEKKILEALRKHEARKVLLRYNVDPKDYWKIRNSYEDNLEGDKELCLFRLKNKAVIAQIIKDNK